MTITAKTAIAVSIATVISASCFTTNKISALVQTPNYEYADEIEECFNLVNEARTEEGSPEIEISYELNYLADVRAKEQTETFLVKTVQPVLIRAKISFTVQQPLREL